MISTRTLLEWVFNGIWITSGLAMVGGLTCGDTMIFGSGLFTLLVSVPIYATYRKGGEMY